MKIYLYTTILAVLVFGNAASAQEVASTEAENCELHIWPTEQYIGFNTGLLSGFGIVGVLADSALHSGKVMTIKDRMRSDLGPDVQIAELRKANVADALGLSGYRIVVEAPLPTFEDAKADPVVKKTMREMAAKLKGKVRLSDATVPCYAELVGGGIMYHKAMMYGSNLFAGWIFRDFGKTAGTPPAVFSGAVKNPLETFPAKTPDDAEAATAELRDAYAKDFVEYVAKKVRRGVARTPAR